MPTASSNPWGLGPSRLLAPFASLAAGLALGLPARAQSAADQVAIDAALGREGALGNSAPLPHDPGAAALLRKGDEAFARARTEGAPGAQSEAFDAWRAALAESHADAAVQAFDPGSEAPLWPDPDATLARRSESVPGAVLRRLAALSPAERAAFEARHGEQADAALAAAGRDPAALARVERDFPATRYAALAALRIADRLLETGRGESARNALERAGRHLRLLAEPGEDLAAALARRRALLAPDAPPAAAGAVRGLRALQSLRLEGVQRSALAPLGRDVHPGLARLADGTLVVQTPRSIVVLDPRAAGGDPAGSIERVALDDVVAATGGAPITAPSTGGWPLLPATDGRRIALVAGRGQPGRRFRDLPLPARGNVLAVLERAPGGRLRAVWQLGDLGLRLGTDPPPPPPEPVRGPDGLPWSVGWEFQPGPAIADGAVLALARRQSDPTAGPGDVAPDTLRVFCLELATGALRWSRDLTRAAELGDDEARGGPSLGIATSGAPLSVSRGRVLVCTNVGVLAALDVLDGRIEFAFRNQRRSAGGGGWAGSRAPVATDEGVWFAPFDSDFAYCVAVRSGAEPLGDESPRFLLAPPLPREEARDLIVAGAPAPSADDQRGPLLVGRSGRFPSLSLGGADGARAPLAYLPDGERIAGRAAVLGRHCLLAGDRHLRAFDLANGGSLTAAAPFEEARATPLGGDVYTAPGRAWVVGLDALWIFALE